MIDPDIVESEHLLLYVKTKNDEMMAMHLGWNELYELAGEVKRLKNES